MCHLLCYTVYKLCIVAACLRPESWLIQLCTTACLCHGHSCFIYFMLHMYCRVCMPWAPLLHILYAVYCHMYCTMGSYSCFVPRALLLDIFYATYILLHIYATDTAVCAKDTATLYIVCCVLTHTLCHGHCYFEPRALLLHIIIVCCVLPHVLCHGLLHIFYFMYYLPHIYVMATACTATCFVLWALLLHVLYPVY